MGYVTYQISSSKTSSKDCCSLFVIVLQLMPSPRRFLVASTTLPLTLGWGWNLIVYVGLFTILLVLMGLLLWMLLKQLRNSVGSNFQPHLGSCRRYVIWDIWHDIVSRLAKTFCKIDILLWYLKQLDNEMTDWKSSARSVQNDGSMHFFQNCNGDF